MNGKKTKKDGKITENGLLRTVNADEASLRLDRWFKRHFPGLAHGQLQKWLRKGLIRVDGKRVDSSFRLIQGAVIRLLPTLLEEKAFVKVPSAGGQPVRDTEALVKSVLYEDEDVVILNKPPGLAVQGDTGIRENLDDSLMVFSLGRAVRPKLVHRLDRDTSGVLLIARNDFSAAHFVAAFRKRETIKIYWAVTRGVPAPLAGKINAPLVKSGQIMLVAQKGQAESKEAESLYKIVEKIENKTAFVALCPLTGRTHQLRVHMAHIGTPLLGDPLYGVEKSDFLPMRALGKGLHLHARRLMIPHPRGGTLDVSAPLGFAMRKTWRWFGFDENADVSFDEVE